MGSVMVELYGFQEGKHGFVWHGAHPQPKPQRWTDYLYLLAHGGTGSGKSRAGAYRATNYLNIWPRSNGVIIAPTFDVLRDSTLPPLFEVFAEYGLIPGTDWDWNKTEHRISMLYNGSTIFLRSAELPRRIAGITAAWFWYDEPGDGSEEAFIIACERLRQTGFPHQGWCTSTPAGKQHWLYRRFYPERAVSEDGEPVLIPGTATEFPDGSVHTWEVSADGRFRTEHILRSDGVSQRVSYAAYPARTAENPHGGAEHAAALLTTYRGNAALIEQALNGEFIVLSGLAFSEWSPAEHIARSSEPWPQICAGIDFGFDNPAAIIVEGFSPGPPARRRILAEVYARGMSKSRIAEEALRLASRFPITYFWCDHDPEGIRELRQVGLSALHADKRHGSLYRSDIGLGRCHMILGARDDAGAVTFTVDPACGNFIREMENAQRAPTRVGRDAREELSPYMRNALDAWRYAEMGIAKFWDRPKTLTRLRVLAPAGASGGAVRSGSAAALLRR